MDKKNKKIDKINVKNKEIVFYLKNFKKSPICKIQEYLNFKKKEKEQNKYNKDIHSNKQISTIIKFTKEYEVLNMKNYTVNIVARLINILCQNANYKFTTQILKKLNNDMTDDEIFNHIRKKINSSSLKKTLKKNISSINFGHEEEEEDDDEFLYITNKNCIKRIVFAQTMKKAVYDYIKNPKFIKNYLDIGCGEGRRTISIGQEFKLKKNNIYGIDVASFQEQGDWNRNNYIKDKFNFSTIMENEPYPYQNNFFSLISSFMVLHHIKDLEFTLQEINRVLRIGGIFLVLEHDCFHFVDKMLADIEHSMYSMVYAKKQFKNFRDDFYTNYFNYIELDIIMKKFGFELVNSDYLSYSMNHNILSNRSYWAVYKKVKNIRLNML